MGFASRSGVSDVPVPLVEEAKRKGVCLGHQAPVGPESGTVVLDSESDCVHLWLLSAGHPPFSSSCSTECCAILAQQIQLHPWDTAPVSNSVSIFIMTRVKVFISWTYKEEWLVSPAA